MKRSSVSSLGVLAILFGGLSAGLAQADAVAAVQVLREGGCGGTLPPATRVHRNPSLDRAAQAWARGSSLDAAVEGSGYGAEAASGLHITGPETATLRLLRQSGCRTVANPKLHDLGAYQRGMEPWLVLASAYVAPPRAQAPMLASRTLELVNQVRARGARCGERAFAPAPPVRLSGTLDSVALGHAVDMAEHNYFEHEDLAGHSPADRVRAVGYQEKLVGENIAYGPKSADEVVQGWLDSPGHCENIMDPRFAEMGIAYAPGQASKRGLYWVQLLAAPRAAAL
ncbi:MAG: CAP domain-containing protein [Steroidobacteraceae bacterium]